MTRTSQDEEMSTQTPSEKVSLWNASREAHEAGELRFSGFEPCYVTCIKDIERRISAVLEANVGDGSGDEVPGELEGLLLQYSQMTEALEKIEGRDRVFEEEDLSTKTAHLHGVKRRIERTRDVDEIYESLKRNWLIHIFDLMFKRDVPGYLRDKYGNLSMTVDRLAVALAGGASMLVPMIIMSFASSVTERLIVVSVATIVFANFMALTSASKENVVAATAAYAAVMVVFLGSAESK